MKSPKSSEQISDIQGQLDGISSQISQFEQDLFGYLVPQMEQLHAENQKILDKLAAIQDALLVILNELDLIELQIEWNNITTQLANHLQKIEYLHLRMSQLNLLNPENTDGSAQAASTTADLAQVFSSEIVAWAKAVLDPGAGVTFGLQAMNSIILKKTAFSRSILEVFVDLMQQGAVSSNQPAVTLQQYAFNLAMAQGKGFMCVAQDCEILGQTYSWAEWRNRLTAQDIMVYQLIKSKELSGYDFDCLIPSEDTYQRETLEPRPDDAPALKIDCFEFQVMVGIQLFPTLRLLSAPMKGDGFADMTQAKWQDMPPVGESRPTEIFRLLGDDKSVFYELNWVIPDTTSCEYTEEPLWSTRDIPVIVGVGLDYFGRQLVPIYCKCTLINIKDESGAIQSSNADIGEELPAIKVYPFSEKELEIIDLDSGPTLYLNYSTDKLISENGKPLASIGYFPEIDDNPVVDSNFKVKVVWGCSTDTTIPVKHPEGTVIIMDPLPTSLIYAEVDKAQPYDGPQAVIGFGFFPRLKILHAPLMPDGTVNLKEASWKLASVYSWALSPDEGATPQDRLNEALPETLDYLGLTKGDTTYITEAGQDTNLTLRTFSSSLSVTQSGDGVFTFIAGVGIFIKDGIPCLSITSGTYDPDSKTGTIVSQIGPTGDWSVEVQLRDINGYCYLDGENDNVTTDNKPLTSLSWSLEKGEQQDPEPGDPLNTYAKLVFGYGTL